MPASIGFDPPCPAPAAPLLPDAPPFELPPPPDAPAPPDAFPAEPALNPPLPIAPAPPPVVDAAVEPAVPPFPVLLPPVPGLAVVVLGAMRSEESDPPHRASATGTDRRATQTIDRVRTDMRSP
jgi:hypothetical protein